MVANEKATVRAILIYVVFLIATTVIVLFPNLALWLSELFDLV
jgi:hypothetical protein